MEMNGRNSSGELERGSVATRVATPRRGDTCADPAAAANTRKHANSPRKDRKGDGMVHWSVVFATDRRDTDHTEDAADVDQLSEWLSNTSHLRTGSCPK